MRRGFLISHLGLREILHTARRRGRAAAGRIALRRFALRRWLRICPAYAASIALTAALQTTAFMTAPRAPEQPASPQPLTPSRLLVAGTAWKPRLIDGI